MMLFRWSGLFLFIAVQCANAADPTYLRCTYTKTMPQWTQGRFMIISVDPDHHLIRVNERAATLNDTTTYRLTEMNDTTVKGAMIDKNGEETHLEIDRISGSMILYVDLTHFTNPSDLKPGERRWSAVSLYYQPTKPVL